MVTPWLASTLSPLPYTLLTDFTLSPVLYTAGHWDGSSK